MASRKFRFVSPGVFLKEIDNSQLPGIPDAVGPVIIGRTRKGPALTPYKVKSLEEFERVFGRTMPGNEGEDPWREGTDLLAESYAPYAAKAYLSADIDSPVTIVRLAGIAGDAAKATNAATPGWASDSSYGLFLFKSGSSADPTQARDITGSLAAIFYGTSTFAPKLVATSREQVLDHPSVSGGSNSDVGAHEGILIKEDAQKKFTVRLGDGSRAKDITFSLDKIREGFNTNPTKTNSAITGRVGETEQKDLSDLYWLGETFEELYKEELANKGGSDSLAAMIVKLDSSMSDFKSSAHALQASKTGWFIPQDKTGASSGVVLDDLPKLFRVIARQDGSKASRELMVSIERISIPRENSTDTFGSFSLVVSEITGTQLVQVERFDNLNLNPVSENYIAKKVGTQYYQWDAREKRNKVYGTYKNISEYVRIELHPTLENAPPSDPSLVPFGFLGPIVPKAKEVTLAANGTGSFPNAADNWLFNDAKARVGALTTNSSSKLLMKWPSLPLVNSGSLSDGFMMGASPFKQTWSSNSRHTTETILNPGYVDYVRRLPEFSGLTTDQDSGEQGANSTEHSFIFSLDDVVLHPSPAAPISGDVGSISGVGDVVLAEYVSGSRNGQGGIASTALLEVTSAGAASGMTANQSVKIISNDSANTARVYVLADTTKAHVDGDLIGVNGVVADGNVIDGTAGTRAGILSVASLDGSSTRRFTINTPTSLGGSNANVTIEIIAGVSGRNKEENKIMVDAAAANVSNLSQSKALIIAAINGGHSDESQIKYASGGGGTAGVAGVQASDGGGNLINLTHTRVGSATSAVENAAGSVVQGSPTTIPAGAPILASNTGGVGVAVNIAGKTQAQVLASLKSAIESAAGHAGKILADDASTTDNALLLRQALPGSSGDTAITDSDPAIANLTTPATFTGGLTAVDSYARSVASGAASSLRTLLNVVDGFRVPLVGGFDGVDITEADPFNNRVLNANNANAEENYAYASVDRAIQLVSDAELVEHNLAVMLGITVPSLTTSLVRACEARGDSLAIIDLPDVYVPPFQAKCDSFESRLPSTGNPENTAKNLTDRQLNSSYGAAYYPWVKIKDEDYNRDVWVPPSVVALGVMAFTEERDEVWFAPAGFNRGGLNEGNAGLPVLQVSDQLMSRDRDTLYAANVNPIASFVSEGIVVFGQKTLQTTQSALDRINVRRLLIFVKKKVSQVSKDLLFEQNVRATWNKFLAQVNPFLESVKTRFGLSDYKVILDSTTTTPDLVDRNILYAKVLLKPARAIEFIAVDFVITNTGASFED